MNICSHLTKEWRLHIINSSHKAILIRWSPFPRYKVRFKILAKNWVFQLLPSEFSKTAVKLISKMRFNKPEDICFTMSSLECNTQIVIKLKISYHLIQIACRNWLGKEKKCTKYSMLWAMKSWTVWCRQRICIIKIILICHTQFIKAIELPLKY